MEELSERVSMVCVSIKVFIPAMSFPIPYRRERN